MRGALGIGGGGTLARGESGLGAADADATRGGAGAVLARPGATAFPASGGGPLGLLGVVPRIGGGAVRGPLGRFAGLAGEMRAFGGAATLLAALGAEGADGATGAPFGTGGRLAGAAGAALGFTAMGAGVPRGGTLLGCVRDEGASVDAAASAASTAGAAEGAGIERGADGTAGGTERGDDPRAGGTALGEESAAGGAGALGGVLCARGADGGAPGAVDNGRGGACEALGGIGGRWVGGRSAAIRQTPGRKAEFTPSHPPAQCENTGKSHGSRSDSGRFWHKFTRGFDLPRFAV